MNKARALVLKARDSDSTIAEKQEAFCELVRMFQAWLTLPGMPCWETLAWRRTPHRIVFLPRRERSTSQLVTLTGYYASAHLGVFAVWISQRWFLQSTISLSLIVSVTAHPPTSLLKYT